MKNCQTDSRMAQRFVRKKGLTPQHSTAMDGNLNQKELQQFGGRVDITFDHKDSRFEHIC